MIKKTLLLLLFFYFLALFQTSFLVHFNWQGIVPNLVLVALIFINLFEKPEKKLGIVSGLLGGFYLDIFSLSFQGFFGFYTLIALAISLFIKFILRKHVRFPVIKKL